ncbi:hypothetical protein XAP6164_4940010 [Xanthomonas phaseoli pv. phaseoli]|nr:hypothetical protein XAP6164_4940010 [Xanthomonas phaseoli pv. phaseoli]
MRCSWSSFSLLVGLRRLGYCEIRAVLWGQAKAPPTPPAGVSVRLSRDRARRVSFCRSGLTVTVSAYRRFRSPAFKAGLQGWIPGVAVLVARRRTGCGFGASQTGGGTACPGERSPAVSLTRP